MPDMHRQYKRNNMARATMEGLVPGTMQAGAKNEKKINLGTMFSQKFKQTGLSF